MSDAAPDLNLVARLLRHVIAEQATVRHGLRVLTEVRVMHSQHARMDNRVRALEAQP